MKIVFQGNIMNFMCSAFMLMLFSVDVNVNIIFR